MGRRVRHLNARDAGATLVLDSRFITGLNDNDAVATWSDRSINGNNATQGTSVNRPLFKTAIQGGNPVVRFDGSNDSLTVVSLVCDQAHTFAGAFIVRGNGTNDTYSPIISYIPSTGPDRGAPLYAKSNNTWASYPRNVNGNFDNVGSKVNNIPYIWSFTYPTAPATWNVNLNGSFLGSGSSTSAADGQGIDLAKQVAPQRFSQIDILQLVAFTGVQPTPVRRRIEQSAAFAFKIPCL